MNDRQRLEAIISVVCKYLPPDGIPINDAMSEIISLVDPLPPPQPEQEPVALVIDGVLVKSALPEKYTGHLYTISPQREWVGLTDEEILALVKTAPALDTAEAEWLHVVRAAEQSLKEKNT